MTIPNQVLQALALWVVAVPAVLALGAFLIDRPERVPMAKHLPVLGLVGGLLLAPAAFVSSAFQHQPHVPALGIRVDTVSGVMLALVGFLGWVIVRYSEKYLKGDPSQVRYTRWLLATLASATYLVSSNNLWAVAVAWFGTSVTLHQLLTLYEERPRAALAAHKKFIVSRLADVCLLGAIACIHYSTGAASFDQLAAWLAQHAQVPGLLIASAILLVMAVVLKSAQLPFHGWLTQVMEAPTPVSALLHAGVINLGGLLMIRLSPLMVRVPAAQWLLVGVGMTTTVVASLIMTTRISIKVSLAWSTCAQMGFMLVQCGLGLWHLALLHLVAHSLYKAHAFLASGRAVQNWRLREFVFSHRPPSPSSARPWIVASMASMVSVSVVASVFHWGAVWHSSTTDGSIVLLLALGLGLTSLWGESNRSLRSRVHRIASVVAIASLYFGSHGLASWLFPSLKAASVSPVAQLLVIGGFALLFSLQWVLRLRPNSAMAKQLYPKLFAGLYLDEWFTRITFRAWPPRLPQARLQRQAAPKQLPIEA